MIRAGLICLLSSSLALAQPLEVSSLECAAAADVERYEDEFSEADDLNPWADTVENQMLYRDEATGRNGVVLRVFPDPETGEALSAPVAADCPGQ